ncbi:thymidylate synthase [Candidatus Poribacteria bacterium]|nr:MAG: thymidylate synthase [Candidatus Poribacteria bacterium]
MKQYLEGLQQILEAGVDRDGRNGKTRTLFGMQMRYNLEDGFPAVTTKKLAFKSVKAELLGFLRGYDHVKQFQKLGTKIWNANAEAWGRDGALGCIYGVQWRRWRKENGRIDQLAEVIEQIKTNPNSRRHIVTAWNPAELDQMALAPCHMLFQFFVADGKLSLQMYQRSCDMFLGVPFNIASYSLLLSMVAQIADLQPSEFIHTLGDAHIYHAHFDQVKTQIKRQPLPLPELILNTDITSIDNFKMQDIQLTEYQHHDPIRAEMLV